MSRAFPPMMAQTIQFVDVTQKERVAVTPLHCGGALVELQQSFPSKVTAISPAVDQLMRFIATFRNADGSETDIEIALREAMTNAVIHGNHEDPNKRAYVSCRCCADGETFITVRDEGCGFDSGTVPDPAGTDSRFSTDGRGIHLMRYFTDEVRFENGGAVVHMRKVGSEEHRGRKRQ